LARGAYRGDPPPGVTAELGQPEQVLSFGLYHQGLVRMSEEKVVDGTAELFSFVIHRTRPPPLGKVIEHMA
jgi:hypothetical protein